MRVAAYARVSTTRQAQAQGIEQQLDRLRAAAGERGWELDDQHVYRDDGYSGARIGRPGLDRLRDHAALAELDVVLVTAPDRLARNYVHQVLLIEELAGHGCQVEFLDRPMSADPHDQLLLQIRGAVAEYERTLIAERMRRGRQAKLRAGTLLPWTTAPFGYRLDPERPRRADAVRVDPGEAALVTQLFDWYLEPGATIYRLARRLTDLGVPAPMGGPRWNVASVRGILRNPAYAGRALSNRTQVAPARGRKSAMLPAGPGQSHAPRPEEDWIAVPVPPIVSEETFAQVQAKLDANQQGAARNTRHEYLLRALISCGACRLSCTGRQVAKGYRYYLCRGRTDSLRAAQGQRCTARYIPAAQLDELVWADLCALLTDPAQAARALARAQGGAWLPQELQARQAAIGQALGQLERQQQRLLDAYLAEVITLPELDRKRQDLDRRRATLLAQQRQLDAAARQKLELGAVADGIEAFCQTIRAGLATATFEQRRLLAELLIDRVIVTDGGVEIRYVLPTSPEGPHRPFCQLCKDHLNCPSGSVSFDDTYDVRVLFRGDERDVIAGFRFVADEDDGDRRRAGDGVPQAGERVHGDRLGLAVAGDRDLRELRGDGDLRERRQAVSLLSGPSFLPGARWREIMEGGVGAQPGRPGHAVRKLPELLPGVGGIGGDVDLAAGQFRGQAGDHAAGQPQPRGRVRALDHQLRHDRDGYGPGDHGQPHPDGKHDPVVPVTRLRRPLRGAVMKPRRCPHSLSPPPEQGVVDEHLHRIPARHQQRDHQPRGGDAQVIGVPPGAGEEAVRPVVRPGPRQARPGQHAAYRPLPGLREETAGQPRERAERRRGEQRGEHGQQRHQRRRDRQCCVREHQRELIS